MIDAEKTENLKRRIDYELQRKAPPAGFPKFPDIPAGRYTSPEFYRLELERLWTRTWLYAGHIDELPETGSYKMFDRVPQMPVFLVRDREGEIRAFYNTCAHRGGCLVREERGKCARLVCGYHAWTYDFTGRLIGVPDQRDFVGLDKSQRRLTPLRCERWGPWIFVNGDLDAPPLREHLGIVAEEFEQFDPNSLHIIHSYSYEIPANWKVAVDAFIEHYHFCQVHAATVGVPGPDCAVNHLGSVMSLFAGGSGRGILPWNKGFKRGVRDDLDFDMGFDAVPDIETTGEISREYVLAYNIFPNTVTPTYSNGIPIHQYWPTSINTTRFDVTWFGRDPGGDPVVEEAWKKKIAAYNLILDEDLVFLPTVQRSMESPAFRGVPLNYQERRIYHLHENIDRVIGRDRIPKELRVEPLLEPYIERPEHKAAIPEIEGVSSATA